MKKPVINQSRLDVNQSVEGERIETKIERIVNNNEPIKDGAPLIYVDRREGVKPSHDIRTDRWEIAVEATDKVAKSYKARREERAKTAEKGEEIGKPEPLQGKPETGTN